MSVHIVRKNGLKYTFHDDESYELYRSGEAYFDSRQDFRNKSDNKFCKCRKPDVQADDRMPPNVYKETPKQPKPIDLIKANLEAEIIYQFDKLAHKVFDWAIYDKALPYLKEKALPKAKELYDMATGKYEPKYKSIVRQEKTNSQTQDISTQIKERKQCIENQESSDALYRVFINYLGLIDALNDLKECNPTIAKQIISTLSDETIISKVNEYLQNNPSVLEAQKEYISINLNRNLVENGILIPIHVTELREKIQSITSDAENI